MYYTDPAQDLVTAGSNLDDLSVDDLSVDDMYMFPFGEWLLWYLSPFGV